MPRKPNNKNGLDEIGKLISIGRTIAPSLSPAVGEWSAIDNIASMSAGGSRRRQPTQVVVAQAKAPGNRRSRRQKKGKKNDAIGDKTGSLSVVPVPGGIGSVYRTKAPRNKHVFRLSKSEFVATIASSDTDGEFNIYYNQRINPGNPLLFPWLSTLAASFKYYRFKRLCFKVIPVNGTLADGTLMSVIQYDVHSPLPINEQEFMALDGATQAPLWVPHCINPSEGECGRIKNRLVFVGSSSPSGSSQTSGDAVDANLYDVGKYLFASSSFLSSEAAQLGKIIVEYDVDLIEPTGIVPCVCASYRSGSGNGVDETAPLGTSFGNYKGTIKIDRVSGTQFDLYEEGEFQVTMSLAGATVTGRPTLALADGTTTNNRVAEIASSAGFSGTGAVSSYYLKLGDVPVPESALGINGVRLTINANVAASLTNFTMWITKISSNVAEIAAP